MAEIINIREDYIRLDNLLKLSALVSSGGEAKMLVLDGRIKVNGEICLMRTKKIREGDTVEYNGKTLTVKKS